MGSLLQLQKRSMALAGLVMAAYLIFLSPDAASILLAIAIGTSHGAYKFKGKRFDCGSVDGFVEATNYFYELAK